MSIQPFERRDFAGAAPDTTLTTTLAAGGLSFGISDPTGWPDGVPGKFLVVIDPDGPLEQKMWCDSRTGSTITISLGDTAAEGSTEKQHEPGAVVRHCIGSTDVDEANAVAHAILGQATDKGLIYAVDGPFSVVAVPPGPNGQGVVYDSSAPGGVKAGKPLPAVHDHSSNALGGAIPKGSVVGLLTDLSNLGTADTTEASTRASADTTLQTNINNEAASRASADSAEATARSNADALLLPIAAGTAQDLTARPSVAANKGLVVKGQASQTGSLEEWQDSTGAPLATVDKDGKAKFPNLPYAESAGTVAIGAISPGSSNAGTITFPAGRFSQPPIVTGSCENNGLTFVMFLNITSAGCDFRVCNAGGVTTSSGTMRWDAVQMTAGSASG